LQGRVRLPILEDIYLKDVVRNSGIAFVMLFGTVLYYGCRINIF
jgi:hypothetical protein